MRERPARGVRKRSSKTAAAAAATRVLRGVSLGRVVGAWQRTAMLCVCSPPFLRPTVVARWWCWCVFCVARRRRAREICRRGANELERAGTRTRMRGERAVGAATPRTRRRGRRAPRFPRPRAALVLRSLPLLPPSSTTAAGPKERAQLPPHHQGAHTSVRVRPCVPRDHRNSTATIATQLRASHQEPPDLRRRLAPKPR